MHLSTANFELARIPLARLAISLAFDFDLAKSVSHSPFR